MKVIKNCVFSLLLAFSLVGCNAETDERTSLELPAFELIHNGQFIEQGGNTSKSIQILETRQQYEATLAKYSSDGAIERTLEGKVVLLLDMGKRHHSGYGILLTRVFTENGQSILEIQTELQGEGCAYATVETNPYVFYLLDAANDYLVRETSVTKTCD